ncbi:MAG: GNAT family N-acetyltransferase [Candidatus Thorarchaeota archaeon]
MTSIRKAKSSDILLLENLYRQEVEDHSERAKKFAEDMVLKYRTLLAIKDDFVYGTIAWEPRGGLNDGVAEIIGLGVNEQFKRKGIATKLVDAVIEDATEFFLSNGYSLRVILLFMESRNETARKFYLTNRFKEVGNVPSLYPHDDASIWTRHL